MKTIIKWVVCFAISYYSKAPFMACIIKSNNENYKILPK